MFSRPYPVAVFAVHQSPKNIDTQLEFYKDWGFIEDTGYAPLEDLPDAYFDARGVSKSNLARTVALRLPGDPYMHLILNQWSELQLGPKWPADYDQIGSRSITLLVPDVSAEVARIKKDFPGVAILHEGITIHRAFGSTMSALLKDPEGAHLELLSIAPGSPYDPSKVRSPEYDEKQWLHFMYMCSNYGETKAFYESFGFEHDPGVDFRPNVGFHPWGFDYFADQMKTGLGFEMGLTKNVGFLRSKSAGVMHIELIDVPSGNGLKDPDDKPVWTQKGISRYCFRVSDYKACLEHQRARGSKIFVEDQRGCLEWGDTQWCFTGDPDDNILCQEQWFPCRYWGEAE
ncbi:MAG: hypothetical protein STHCBS139747_004829 [Sporothrix thermara]